MEPIYAAIGAQVAYLRISLDVTQEDFARKIGITKASLINFEAGNQRCPLHMIERFAFALNTTPKNLLKGIWF